MDAQQALQIAQVLLPAATELLKLAGRSQEAADIEAATRKLDARADAGIEHEEARQKAR